MKTTQLIVFLCCLPLFVLGQNVYEDFFIHTNQPAYTSGESVWFSAKMLNFDSTTQQSKVLHIALVNRNNETKLSQKHLLTNGVAKGSFTIPPSWQEGNYLLIAYTLWNLNFGEDFIANKTIPIYSLNQQVSINTVATSIPNKESSSTFRLSKNKFSRNQSISLTINSIQSSELKQVSVAIRDWEQLPLVNSSNHKTSSNSTNFNGQFPKETSLMAYGTIQDSETSELINTGLLSVYGTENTFFARGSSFYGEFSVSLPNFYGEETLQFHNLDRFQATVPSVKVKEWKLPQIDLSAIQKKPSKSNEIIQYINQRQKEVQLQSIFQLQNTIETEEVGFEKVVPIPSKSYKTSDYQLLKNMEEFIDEAIPISRFLKKKKQRTVRLFNDEAKEYFDNSPWFLLDGYWVTNEQSVFAIEFKEIETIDLYDMSTEIKRSFEPLLKLNGILALHSKLGKSLSSLIPKENQLALKGFTPTQLFNPEIASSNSGDKAPNLRNTIAWFPELKMEGNAINVSLPPQNRVGLFVVEIVATTSSGEVLNEQLFFEIGF